VILLNILQALCGACLRRSSATRFALKLGTAVAFLVVVAFVVLSFSRVVSLNVNYSAPVLAYTHLYTKEFEGGKFDDVPRKGVGRCTTRSHPPMGTTTVTGGFSLTLARSLLAHSHDLLPGVPFLFATQ
jgi:hypothetical protein